MRQTATNPTSVQDSAPRPLQLTVCVSCESGAGDCLFGGDPDGFVLCRECRSPLFYCDIGGQG